MTRNEWNALAERCEKATGPNIGIEDDIATATGLRVAYEGHPIGRCWYDRDGRAYPFERYSSSLDAIVALIERELPAAWVWTLGQNIHHRTWGASINNLDEDGAPYSVCWGQSSHTPALALCAAFCRAMGSRANG